MSHNPTNGVEQGSEQCRCAVSQHAGFQNTGVRRREQVGQCYWKRPQLLETAARPRRCSQGLSHHAHHIHLPGLGTGTPELRAWREEADRLAGGLGQGRADRLAGLRGDWAGLIGWLGRDRIGAGRGRLLARADPPCARCSPTRCRTCRWEEVACCLGRGPGTGVVAVECGGCVEHVASKPWTCIALPGCAPAGGASSSPGVDLHHGVIDDLGAGRVHNAAARVVHVVCSPPGGTKQAR